MKLCIDYLREIESSKGWSRYRISRELGLSSQRVYQLFDTGGTYDDSTAIAIAKILEIEPTTVVAAAHLERAKTPELKAIWEGILEKISMGFNDFIKCATPRRIKLSA